MAVGGCAGGRPILDAPLSQRDPNGRGLGGVGNRDFNLKDIRSVCGTLGGFFGGPGPTSSECCGGGNRTPFL